jgi:uncharacterized membrane protein YfcA
MTPVELAGLLFAASVAAGLLGSVLGVGGGFVVIPVLTLLFGVDIRLAIGASVVAVVATSVAAAPGNLDSGLSNMRVAIFLAMATTVGALSGAWLSGRLDPRVLYVVFGAVLALTGWQMARKVSTTRAAVEDDETEGPRSLRADRLGLSGSYRDPATGSPVAYNVVHPLLGLSLMYVAGTVGGLLGIGSGVLKVPAMDVAMRLPLRVSMATSNLLIGVTAASASLVYLLRGDVDPFLAGPGAAGVLLGAWTGGRLLPRVRLGVLTWGFLAVVAVVAVEMLWKGLS